MNTRTIMLNGQEKNFNLYDADCAAAYERALEALAAANDGAGGGKLSEIIRREVAGVRRFLDVLFGDGTAEVILGEADDLNVALECVEAVTKSAAEQGEELQRKVAAYKR